MDAKESMLALKHLGQGDFIQARTLLSKLLKSGDLVVKQGYDQATENLLRRYWRQAKVKELIQMAEGSSQLTLAIARLQGKDSMQKVSEEDGKESFLAKLFLSPSLKDALLLMRQLPGYKEMAEGWIALRKKDFVKAKNSFQAASLDQPRRSEIALAIIDALEGTSLKESEAMFTFLKAAVFRFPRYAELLGKKKEGQATILSKDFIFFHCFQGTFEVLEKILSRLQPSQKEEKGWIYARLGDLTYANERNRSKALVFWLKAVNVHPGLELDMLKRQFISLYKEDRFESKELFLEYFHALYRKDKKIAGEFLLEVLLKFGRSYYSVLPIPFFSYAQDKWLISKPSLEVVYFALTVLISEHEEAIELKIPCAVQEGSFLLPDSIAQFLPELDLLYPKEEHYWKLRANLGFILNDQEMRRRALARLMEIKPSCVEERMPEYVQAALLTLTDKVILEEVRHLASFLKSYFDLTRLQMFLGDPVDAYIGSFSPSLKAVLHLQEEFDKKKTIPKDLLSKVISLYGKDQEADWRFWHLIAYSNFFPKPVRKIFDEGLKDEPAMERIFMQIARYQETGLSLELLGHWRMESEKAWMPDFFVALDHLLWRKTYACLDFLKAARNRINKKHPWYDRIISIGAFIIKDYDFFDNDEFDDDEEDEDE